MEHLHERRGSVGSWVPLHWRSVSLFFLLPVKERPFERMSILKSTQVFVSKTAVNGH